MMVFKPKNRILTLRLSEEDYHVLREASARDGARSLSDYARDTLFRTARSPTGVHDLTCRLAVCEAGMMSLTAIVRQLEERVSEERSG